jgi:ACS family tartrate transporter-like MFS transporter
MTTPSQETSPIAPSSVEGLAVRKLLWRLLPFLFLLYVVNYLDRINVGFAKLQMQGELGFSNEVFGTAFGIFFFGYSIFQVPSNLALQRVGARRWMAGIMVLWGIVSCCMIFAHTPRGFYRLRFVLGLAEAGFFPGIILYMKTWFPATARARAVAWFMTANPLAGVIGGPISGALLNLHLLGVSGWKWMFLLEGIPAVLLAGVVWFTLQDEPKDAAWLDPDEKRWLVEALQQEREIHAHATRQNLLAAIVKLGGQILLLTIVYFGLTTSAYGLILWLPSYIHSLSTLGNLGIGFVSVIPYIATAFAMVVVGTRSDRTGKHRLHLAASALSAAVFVFLAAQTNSIVPGMALVSLSLMATFCMQGPFWATATSMMSGTAAAAGIAVINSLGNLGGFYGPYIVGLKQTSGAGFRGGMLVISGCLAVAGVVSCLVRSRSQRPS